MPNFTFSGFPVGLPVSVLAERDAQSASNSVATWGQGSTDLGTVGIEVTNHGALEAPGAVWLKATNPDGFNVSEPESGVFDPSYHDITYIWTVRGEPILPFKAPQNMVDGWNNPNVMYGKHVAFYFPDAGVYDIDLRCVESESVTATASTQIEVLAPAYPGVNTIAVALDGDFNGAPTGTQVTSIAALEASIQGRTDPTRISFKPGETHNDFRIEISRGNIVRVDTWTPGGKVNLNLGGSTGASRGFDNGFDDGLQTRITFRDLNIDGEWDPTTETGETLNLCFQFARIPQRCDFTIADCVFRGMSFLNLTMRDYGGVSGCRLVMANSVVEDWQGYGVAHFPNADSRAFIALLGNRIKQNPLALGGGPKTSMQNDHGCIRVANAEHLILVQNDFFTTSGWSGWPPNANAATRLHTTVFPNSSTLFERNVVEGGYTKIKIDGQNEQAVELVGNHMFERNLLIGTARTLLFARMHYGGTTFRNNLLYMPDVPVFDGLLVEFVNVEPDNPDPSNDAPFSIYNNSFVSRETAGTRAQLSGSTTYWSNFTNENNVYFALGNTGASLDFTTPLLGIEPRYEQVRFNFQMYVANLSSDVPNGATTTIPFAALDRSTGFSHGTLITGSTTPTNQAYWQSLPASDNLHMLRVNGAGLLQASKGQFTVDYDSDPSNVVITNTSGVTWSAGQWEVRLDRKSQLDVELPAATVYESPSIVPTCAPPSPGTDTLGKLAYSDFFGTKRVQPVAPGAIEA